MNFSDGVNPTQKMMSANMNEKMNDNEFRNDIFTILRPIGDYDNDLAFEIVTEKIISKI